MKTNRIEHKTEVLVIGSGLTGLLSCYFLMNDYKVTLVDAREKIGSESYCLTGKATVMHGLVLQEILKEHSFDKAKDYYLFNKEGLNIIKNMIHNNNISCDMKVVMNKITVLHKKIDKIHKESEIYHKLGVSTTIEGDKERVSLGIDDQISLNITKYLNALVELVLPYIIYIPSTIITGIKDNTAYTNKKEKIYFQNCIVATKYPIYSHCFAYLKLKPYMGVLYKENSLEVMDIHLSKPMYSVKTDTRCLNSEAMNLKNLNQSIKLLNPEQRKNAWANMDFVSLDYLPSIGEIKPHVYVAYGYSKWGVTTSHRAALLLSNLIANKEDDFKNTFNPKRKILNAKAFYNLAQMPVAYFLSYLKTNTIKLNVDEGRIFYHHFKRLGYYLAEDSNLYVVKAVCPHLKCGLYFNNIDKTYDCPCHGSRYDYKGRYLEGPSKRNLELRIIENYKSD